MELTGQAPQVQISYAQPPNPPVATTGAASGILQESAEVNATVNPEDEEVSACYFQYGTSETYGESVPCSSPPGAGTNPVAVSAYVTGLSAYTTYHYRIVATNSNGTSYGADKEFKTLLHNPPAVSSIGPERGPTAGETSVTITGTNFEEASAVRFGSADATSFTINSPESITAVSPKGVGTVYVSVATPDGTSPQNPAAQFTFVPVPVITRVFPATGPETGETAVTITGGGFTAASAVKFGSSQARSFTVNSDSAITAVSPSGRGTVDVTVMNSIGEASSVTAGNRLAMRTVHPNTAGASPRLLPQKETRLSIKVGSPRTPAWMEARSTRASSSGNPESSKQNSQRRVRQQRWKPSRKSR